MKSRLRQVAAMELSRVWVTYCEKRLGPAADKATTVAISPKDTHELLYEWNGLFTRRASTLLEVPYSTEFDDEADAALCEAARVDNFRSWERLSAGAWRNLLERLTYAQGVALTNEMAGTDFIAWLPSGLSRRERSRAVGLQYLLGGARTIDPKWLSDKGRGAQTTFPASTSLRPQ